MSKTMENNGPSSRKNIRLRGKNQVTLPADVVEALHLTEGEQLEVTVENGHVVLVPVMTIEKDQAWFWTKEWQQEEQEIEEEIEQGAISDVMTAEDTLKWLHTPDEEK